MYAIERVISTVPEIPRYLGADELAVRTAVQARTGAITLQEIGCPATGETIEAIIIGTGRPVVMAYGFAHGNDPLGGTALDHLVSALVNAPELLAELDCTLCLVKCADPDSARRNEGWIRGPYRLLPYALHSYRQPGVLPNHPQRNPKTAGLLSLIDRVRPDIVLSLGNSSLGGATCWLTSPAPAAHACLADAAARHGLPLHQGEAPDLVAPSLYPGIYRCLSASDPNGSPVRAGNEVAEYAGARGAVPLLVNTPLFVAPVVGDSRPSGVTRRRAALNAIAAARGVCTLLQDAYRQVSACLDSETRDGARFWAAMTDELDSREARVLREPGFQREASVAELYDLSQLRRADRMVTVGMAIRWLEGQGGQPGAEEGSLIEAAQSRLLEHLAREAAELAVAVHFWAAPIRQAACHQLAVMSVAIDLWRLGALDGCWT